MHAYLQYICPTNMAACNAPIRSYDTAQSKQLGNNISEHNA
jgi:hypothetical protein